MKYMGSKARIANDILPIILKDRKPEQYFVDLFAGGMNIIDKVDGNRIANDINPYLIEFWKGLQKGRLGAMDIPKAIYDNARNEYNKKTANSIDFFTIGWIGFMGSANGRFFEGGYSGISNTTIGTQRDYISESIRNILKQMPLIDGIVFNNLDYRQLEIPSNSIVYCDKPYEDTKKYSHSFNHKEFWDWARKESKKNKVFISEYQAPKDFECVWEKEVKSSLSANGIIGGSKVSTERLFKYKFN